MTNKYSTTLSYYKILTLTLDNIDSYLKLICSDIHQIKRSNLESVK